MTYILVGLLCAAVGWYIGTQIAIKNLADSLTGLDPAIRNKVIQHWQGRFDEPSVDNIMVVEVEDEDGQLFAYRSSDKRFLAQAQGYQALLEQVFLRTGENKISVIMDKNYREIMP
jgi:hypothetical protein